MTMVAGWIRRGEDGDDELVMASDSRVTGGADWDAGPKLFDLGRRDCLLGFCGACELAFPLAIHAERDIRHDPVWTDPRLDIEDVKDFLLDLWSELSSASHLTNTSEARPILLSGVRFLLGGWSWRERRFRLWEIIYDDETDRFRGDSRYDPDGVVWTLLVDPQNDTSQGEEAQRSKFRDQLKARNTSETEPLDMQPFGFLWKVADSAYRYVGGRVQLGKVYASGGNEFFGVQGPAANEWTFMGRRVHPYDPPSRRFVRHNSGESIGTLPDTLPLLDGDVIYDERAQWVRQCYSGASGALSPLPHVRRQRLEYVLQAAAYAHFLRMQSEAAIDTETADEVLPTEMPVDLSDEISEICAEIEDAYND